MSISEICTVLEKWDCDRIVLTGGEPALQNLWPLRRILQERGYRFAIETNGTIELEEGLVDWICVSPKDQLYPDVSIKQRVGDELKVVYVGQDLAMYDSLKLGFEKLYLQPCYFESESIEWNGVNFRTTMEQVLQNPGWTLSLQTHKWLDVR
jgi:organic radical activating enzyme